MAAGPEAALPPEIQARVLRFGVFEVNLASRELSKHGIRIRLPGQPFLILSLLLEKPGEVVTRDEMRQRLWPSDTFVDFEHSLNSAVKKLRAALGDSPENSRYIETIPRVGYRFIAPIQKDSQAIIPSPPSTEAFQESRIIPDGRLLPRPRAWSILAIIGVPVGVALVMAGLYHRAHLTKPLSTKDTIVLADFTNSTGDSVFDDTLRQGLAAQLEQSPFLNLLSNERISQTLLLMTKPKDSRVTNDLAMEICRRTGSTAVIEGSIATLGGQYVLGLKAVACRSGDSLANIQITSDDKERVLNALGKASSRLRERLGESLGSVQKYDKPQESVTTSSLEALNAYTLGMKARHENADEAAIPFLQRAIQLDPNFAMAYLALGIVYWDLDEAEKGRLNLEKAFALRDRVSVLESFDIGAAYHDVVTGDLTRADEIYNMWAQTYPHDRIPLDGLGNNYLFRGQFPDALEVLLRERNVAGGNFYNYINLSIAYLCLDRYEAARNVIRDGLARNMYPEVGHAVLYRIDFVEHNEAGLREDLDWAAGKTSEDQFVLAQADTEAYSGRRQRAWMLARKAIALAERENETEVAATNMAHASLNEAELGNSAHAGQIATAAVGQGPFRDAKVIAALALARAGYAKRAQTMANELARTYPSNTILNYYWLPCVRAAAELSMGHPNLAIETLEVTRPYELGVPLPIGPGTLYPAYLRGEAYLIRQETGNAVTEFQKLINHPGIIANFPLGALAHLQLARAYAEQRDPVQARQEYQKFLTLWEDADSDLPQLNKAKVEYSRLTR